MRKNILFLVLLSKCYLCENNSSKTYWEYDSKTIGELLKLWNTFYCKQKRMFDQKWMKLQYNYQASILLHLRFASRIIFVIFALFTQQRFQKFWLCYLFNFKYLCQRRIDYLKKRIKYAIVLRQRTFVRSYGWKNPISKMSRWYIIETLEYSLCSVFPLFFFFFSLPFSTPKYF